MFSNSQHYITQLFLIELFALALNRYSQNSESASNVVYSFTALPLELIQHNYDLGDYDCSTFTLLSLLSDIHTCCLGTNGSRVAICSITCIKNFLLLAFPIVSHSCTTLYSDMEGCKWLSNMGKAVWSCLFIRSSEDKNPIWSGVKRYTVRHRNFTGKNFRRG